MQFPSNLSTVMNASGCHCRTKAQLDSLVAVGMKTIITKTCTLFPNKGNAQPVFLEIGTNASVNCLGMPNLGYSYYRDLYLEYKLRGITYIISIDASNSEQLLEMLQDYDTYLSNLKRELRISAKCLEYVEINVSCPSTTCPRIIAYDILAFARLLETIKSLDLANIVIGIKLAPYIDKVLLEQIANIIIQYSTSARIKYIVCSNSIPNGMVIDNATGQPKLSAKTGGISGTINKLISISNVYQFNQIFSQIFKSSTDIKIIGCGGIENADDVNEYLQAGAYGVQIGRTLYLHGTSILTNFTLNAKL
jgi:dihydroorotate dehydrogenase (fumarate)